MQDCWRHPFLPHEEPVDQTLMSPPLKSTSSHYPCNGSPFMFRCMRWVDKVCHHCPGGVYSESKWEQESTTKCKVSTTGPVPDRWHSSRVSEYEAPCIPENVFKNLLAGPRWKVQCRGKGYVVINVGILDVEVLITPMKLERYNWSWFLQSHLSLFLRLQAQKGGGVKMDMLASTSTFGMIILS